MMDPILLKHLCIKYGHLHVPTMTWHIGLPCLPRSHGAAAALGTPYRREVVPSLSAYPAPPPLPHTRPLRWGTYFCKSVVSGSPCNSPPSF